MKVPEVIEKIMEKIRELSGRPFLLEDEITISMTVDVELDESQYENLTKVLKSMGYNFYKRGTDELGFTMVIYRNDDTDEYVSIGYIKDEKYYVRVIIYHWGSGV
jgi:uncharacterized protein involved in type VI secretion and phage assembly